jgi:tetraacyldisaccharide 4'-kinase
VVDASRRNGNGHCLPAGPLREPVSRLDEVNIVAYHVTEYNAGHNNGQDADGTATAAPGPCSYTLKMTAVQALYDGSERALSSFAGTTVHAVAGIGHPARFFQQLREQGLDIIEHAFADHHAYQQHDFSGWQQCCIIMTEKDAVKCRHLALTDAWVLAVDAELSAGLRSRLDAWLSTHFELALPAQPQTAAASSDRSVER